MPALNRPEPGNLRPVRPGNHGVRPGNHGGLPTGLSLPDVVHRFKTMTTKRYTDGVKQNGWMRFDGKLWQRNYWEHIIRNENELNRIREYIQNNPTQWGADRLYGPSLNDLNSIREPSPEYAIEAWMV